MLRAVRDSLISVFYPTSCRICGRSVEESSNGVSCRQCWLNTEVVSLDLPCCEKCGLPFASAANQSPGSNCGVCSDFYFDRARAAGKYEGALAAIIIELKLNPTLPYTAKQIFFDSFERNALSADILIPVPLSDRRRLERGFNQAAVLSRELSIHYGIHTDEWSLIRAKHTQIHRVGMDRKARQLTVANAFKITRPRLVAGKSILLIDDVLTSGATASSCARELKKAGAKCVNVLTLARAVKYY